MKCPHCQSKLPFSSLKKSFFRPQPCSSCNEGYTVTLSISRMFLLIIPVAFSLIMIRPISLHWGVSPTLMSALIVLLYGVSCLTLVKRAVL
ncbi:hypothetical protein ABFY09_06505 [Marinomonas sp. 5E14-1]|uniref:hypothetical protein n=1 Tax=Marinomonas sp. 5E14-1 TaxID=3153922 RepID=UPI0032648A92